MEFRLPELGEGITQATVVNVLVKAGDAVTKDQPLLEVETEKASMPIPSPVDGTVGEVRVKQGESIPVGSVIAVISGDGQASPKKQAQPGAAAASPPAQTPKPQPSAAPAGAAQRVEFTVPNLGEGIEEGTIVGVNIKAGDTIGAGQEAFTIETDKASVPIPSPASGTVEEVRVQQGQKVSGGAVLAVIVAKPGTAAPATPRPTAPPARPPAPAPAATATANNAAPARPSTAPAGDNGPTVDHLPVPAGPATRRFARELGVNLREVSGSARGGRVTVDDVKGYVHNKMTEPRQSAGSLSVAAPPLPDFARYGPVERKAASNLRKKIAENLTIAWHTAAMVTQYDQADITELEAGRKRSSEGRPKDAPKTTMTVLAVKAVVATLKEFPHFNASYDAAAGELIYKKYYHIGIAVDTERGLVVPVIRDADKKGIPELAAAVTELAEKARAGKLTPDEMQGGTFTITNLGGIGGTAFSPIVRYPELAILGLARSSLQPVVREGGGIEPRLILPLCLTYDHRIIDGADGARFTNKLARLLSDPVRMLMEG
jgi:pyruvate dehydrogenase E2 component (dihydrolipoyllysine-residue acetyltransferase)